MTPPETAAVDRPIASPRAQARCARPFAAILLGFATLHSIPASATLPLVATLHPQGVIPTNFFAGEMDVDGRRVIVGAFQGAFIFSAPTTPGGDWSQDQFLPGTSYGTSVALRGDMAAIGDDGANYAAQQAGAASIFRRSTAGATYTRQQVVWPADAAIFDQFGAGVTLGEGVAFVGADNDTHHDKTSTGTVTMYRPAADGSGRFEEARKFAPLDLAPGGNFGDAIDLDGDVLVVGASGNGASEGAAYVYERNAGGAEAWAQVAKLEYPGRFYGEDVAVSGRTLLVSRAAPAVGVLGAVDVFDRQPDGAWTRTARLEDPDSGYSDGYGFDVALNGDLAAVSSRFGDPAGGEVHVYSRHRGGPNAWGLLATLTSPNPDGAEYFGTSVEIMDNMILVGGLGLFDPPYGGVYVFAVPEPAAGALLAAGAILVASRRRPGA